MLIMCVVVMNKMESYRELHNRGHQSLWCENEPMRTKFEWDSSHLIGYLVNPQKFYDYQCAIRYSVF